MLLATIRDALRHRARAAGLARLDLDIRGPVSGITHPAPDDPGAVALEEALRLWSLGIEEPPAPNGAAYIDAMMRGPAGLGWTWLPPYRKNRDQAWCGAFAAACWCAAGMPAKERGRHLASTRRLAAWVECARVRPWESRAGDIAVVGTGKGELARVGEHITVVDHLGSTALDDHYGLLYTVEGNAMGLLPDGRVAEGVVKRTRPLEPTRARCPVSGRKQWAHVIAVYRPEVKT